METKRPWSVQLNPALPVALGMAMLALAAPGCDESESAEPVTDAGDTDTLDAGPDGPSTCVACHSFEEALVASLEADPLPEEEDGGVSTGEG
jgi:hypothetical protein